MESPRNAKASLKTLTLAVIPCRIGSTRLARKPLLRDTGKFLFQHVYERCLEARTLDHVVVATDSDEIEAAARSFGAEVTMTSKDHPSGSDRVLEVARAFEFADVIVNVQGDEPEISPHALERLVDAVRSSQYPVATLAAPLAPEDDPNDPAIVKVVCSGSRAALLFTRAAVPFDRTLGSVAREAVRRHVGVYAYRRETLLRFGSLPVGHLERLESLEQLRLLENDIGIQVIEIDRAPEGIDTRADYERFVQRSRRGV
ncbi:MAG: 3-deoxy-manno-octulosonate cytidylyltransferase [Planctomycetes bacterium]|nr:3-deoxy-manno-octulosonate cytidylyltransferase [Planctomycetota bacterium]